MKKKEIEITYTYIEPKTKEDPEEAERRLAGAYDIIFEAVLRKRREEGCIGVIGQYPLGTKSILF